MVERFKHEFEWFNRDSKHEKKMKIEGSSREVLVVFECLQSPDETR